MSEKPIKLNLPDKDTLKKIIISKGADIQQISGTSDTANYKGSSVVRIPITKNSQFAGSGANVIMTQPMFFSPLHTPQNWQTASKRKEIYQWARHFYENEPKVAAGIDFYSQFPINGLKLECKKKSVLRYFERLVEKIELMTWLRMISCQRFLLGDVYVMTEIECPHCEGSGVDKETKDVCNHKDGTICRLVVLNPDWVEVSKTPISNEPQIVLLPDEELQKIVQTKQPKKIYDQIPDYIKMSIVSKTPIVLSNRVTSHLKHGGSPYGTYGESLLRRLFTVLAYKTKLMTANWIIAERLILPVRVIQLGSDERPATDEDIADVASQLAAIANDPNLTLITHNNFNYEWYGSTGKIHNINQELEYVGKEILDGLMLNQTLLNGEMAGYNSAQVGVEVMIRRLESWRNELAQWIEKRIFLPVAKMQGFIDEEETKEFNETTYLYPRVKWNDLRLRDNTNQLQMFLQMQQSGLISSQTLLEQFDLDYDLEIERIREEQVQSMQNGQLGGGQGGMPGGGGGMPGGGAPGGAPMGDMNGMPPPGGAPGMDGSMGGGMPGGMDMGGGMGGASASPTASSGPTKIFRRGKGPKDDDKDIQPMKPTTIQLTKPESKMYKTLSAMKLPFSLFAQYRQPVPNDSNFYLMDFAFPQIGVDIECLHPDEFVQTKEGSKKCKNVEEGEFLIGRDGSYVKVKRVYNRKYNGELISIKPKGMLPIIVTPNHPILIGKKINKSVKREEPSIIRCRTLPWPDEPVFINAEKINIGDYVAVPVVKREEHDKLPETNLTKAYTTNSSAILDKDLGWLLGMYVAEGCSSVKNTIATFSLSCDEDNFANKICQIVKDKFVYGTSVYKDQAECSQRVCVFGKYFAESMISWFGHGARNKKLPGWFFNAPSDFIWAFIEGLCDGDGCRRENEDMRILSSSKALLLDLQMILLSRGEFSSVVLSRNACETEILSKKCYQNELWEMTILLDRKHSYHRTDHGMIFVPITSIETIEHDGCVVNFETSGEDISDHTFAVGNILTHNCDGEKWHSSIEDKQKDKERDLVLASLGWRVLRFTEAAIGEQLDKVQQVIQKEVMEAAKEKKYLSKKAETGIYENNISDYFSPFDGCIIFKRAYSYE